MFNSPWYFLLLVLVPIAAWRLFSKRHASAVRVSSAELASRIPTTLRQRLNWLPAVLTLLAMTLLIVALARPREGKERAVTDTEGIAIELVVDRSGSMQAMDFQIDGHSVDRLTAIKNVAGKFVAGGENLEGRYSDLVGLVSFAGFADGLTPPTLDHAFVVGQLNSLRIVSKRQEDGTAIGDALSLAVEKLNSLDARYANKVKSKIIILLTDGENTAGQLTPQQGAELAETMGIKVYTIGVGTKGRAPIPVMDPFSGRQVMQWMQVTIDEESLQQVADLTGGKYFRATDTRSLENIYAEIDRLEKTKVESRQFVDYRELAVQSFQTGFIELPPLVLLAFILLILRSILQNTWLREFV